ncbi:MAG: ribbon-helix-helix protein, CopG family [Acidobacteria bacterium]|nr:ribbon-helix-helix protein, CopG family [Acidobacteriota bacterium]
MRTTLTLDDDVAALLRQLLRSRKTSLKELVNEALRNGLRVLGAPPPKKKRFVQRTFDGGKLLIPSLDNIAEALAIAEGEDYK